MTKYEELNDLATRGTEALYADKAQNSEIARQVMLRLRGYLEATADTCMLVALNGDLESTEETGNFAKLLYGLDGAWHFGVRLKFKNPKTGSFGVMTLKCSIRTQQDAYELSHERSFRIDPTKEESFDSFNAYVFESLREQFRQPVGTPKRGIGFLLD